MSSKPPTTPTGLQAFYTVDELAERWRVCGRHVRRLIKAEELKATCIGKAIRISAAQVALYEAMRGL